jgi:hypothetical protein
MRCGLDLTNLDSECDATHADFAQRTCAASFTDGWSFVGEDGRVDLAVATDFRFGLDLVTPNTLRRSVDSPFRERPNVALADFASGAHPTGVTKGWLGDRDRSFVDLAILTQSKCL